MRQKLAFFTFIAVVLTCLFGLGDPNEPLTIMVSNNGLVIIVKALLAAAVLGLAANFYSGTRRERSALALTGGALFGFCLWSLVSTSFLSQIFGYVRLLDVMMLMEIGILLLWTAVELKIVPAKSASRLPNLQLLANAPLRERFVTYFTYLKYRYL